MVLFFGKEDYLSNFYIAPFKFKGISFSCVEQFMMYSKARTFGDNEIAAKILLETDQKEIKNLGRKVSNYNDEVWAEKREKVVFIACREKFLQNPELKERFLLTDANIIVEASPYDKIWGVGLSEDDPLILDSKNWRGQNKLGNVLMAVRDYLVGLENKNQSNLLLKEHPSSSYAPRTWHNAKSADLTIAIAIDYGTQGEILTKKAAGNKYLKLDWLDSPEKNAKILLSVMEKDNLESLNIAGNGVYSFVKRDIGQEQVNKYVYELLSAVHSNRQIKKIFTGGQTGVDIAGAIAGFALGVETEVTFPKGYKQRNSKGYDHEYTKQEIFESIKSQSERLLQIFNGGAVASKLKP